MWSIIELIGIFLSFLGSALLATTAIKSKKEILSEATPKLPVSSGPPGTTAFENAVLKLPQVQGLFRQSKIAKWGLWILTIGFFLQFIGALLPLIYASK
jgi:uncharacterized membrane protein